MYRYFLVQWYLPLWWYFLFTDLLFFRFANQTFSDFTIFRRIYLILKRRSSSLMDHSLAFCLLISGDSQYYPFWWNILNKVRNDYQYHRFLCNRIMTLIRILLSQILSFAFSYIVILNIVRFEEAFLLRIFYNDSQFHRYPIYSIYPMRLLFIFSVWNGKKIRTYFALFDYIVTDSSFFNSKWFI